jgi:hypothetical protein
VHTSTTPFHTSTTPARYTRSALVAKITPEVDELLRTPNPGGGCWPSRTSHTRRRTATRYPPCLPLLVCVPPQELQPLPAQLPSALVAGCNVKLIFL